MIIEAIVGIKKMGKLISEREFPLESITSTSQMLQDYFMNYGYQFVGFFDFDKDLIIVKNNNQELSILQANSNLYQVINYKTGTIVMNDVPLSTVSENRFPFDKCGKIQPIFYTIEEESDVKKLVGKTFSDVILEAQDIHFLNDRLVLVRNYGMEILFDLVEKRNYPLHKREKEIYVGRYPENFMDMRSAMYTIFQNTIHPVAIEQVDLKKLVERYPYGEKIKNHFRLLDSEIYYGIFYQNEDKSLQKWYSSKEERDKVLEQLGFFIEKELTDVKVKMKSD